MFAAAVDRFRVRRADNAAEWDAEQGVVPGHDRQRTLPSAIRCATCGTQELAHEEDKVRVPAPGFRRLMRSARHRCRAC